MAIESEFETMEQVGRDTHLRPRSRFHARTFHDFFHSRRLPPTLTCLMLNRGKHRRDAAIQIKSMECRNMHTVYTVNYSVGYAISLLFQSRQFRCPT